MIYPPDKPQPPITGVATPCATHHDACACREAAKRELREAAEEAWRLLNYFEPYKQSSYGVTMKRLRKALEATR